MDFVTKRVLKNTLILRTMTLPIYDGYDEIYDKKVKIKHNAYILNRTTAISSTGQQTTCLPIFALWGTIRAHDRWSLPLTSWPNGQWHFLKPVQDETVPSRTLPRRDITLGFFWTTVFHVIAANSLIETKIKRVLGR